MVKYSLTVINPLLLGQAGAYDFLFCLVDIHNTC